MHGRPADLVLQTELLLDRLVLLCSAVILQHMNISNTPYILSDATHLHAQELVERTQSIMAVNMELMLESGMLDGIPTALVESLAQYIRAKQMEKSPVSRSSLLTEQALIKHADWLELQDIPGPINRSKQKMFDRDFTGLPQSPHRPGRNVKEPPLDSSPHQSPSLLPNILIRLPPSNDDIFLMDDPDDPAPLSGDNAQLPSTPSNSQSKIDNPSPVWKATSVPRLVSQQVKQLGPNLYAFSLEWI